MYIYIYFFVCIICMFFVCFLCRYNDLNTRISGSTRIYAGIVGTLLVVQTPNVRPAGSFCRIFFAESFAGSFCQLSYCRGSLSPGTLPTLPWTRTATTGQLKVGTHSDHFVIKLWAVDQYRILQSNQLNYREIGVARARVARIAEALEQLNFLVLLPL